MVKEPFQSFVSELRSHHYVSKVHYLEPIMIGDHEIQLELHYKSCKKDCAFLGAKPAGNWQAGKK